jgi:hypothetical protein
MKRRNPSYTIEKRGETKEVSMWVFAIPIIRRAEECFCARAKRDASICEEAIDFIKNKNTTGTC